eukprot:885318-Prymnesium_polylepis.1
MPDADAACQPCEPAEAVGVEAPWLAAGVQYQRKFASARAPSSEGASSSDELLLGGKPCAALLCWPYIKGADTCGCQGTLAHVLRGACGRAINGALGRCASKTVACRGVNCRAALHPTAEDIRAALGAWWQETKGEPPVFALAASQRQPRSHGTSAAKGERSAASAAEGGGGTPARCTLPAARVVELLRAHEADSPYIAAFLEAPYLQSMLDDESLRALLAMRSRVKEVSEAFSVCEVVRSVAGAERIQGGGEGMVVFDVCSGKGLGATLLSFLLPKGKIVMLDANGHMELSHVQARPNLSFRHLDIFSDGAPALLREEAAGASFVMALGMHLCGALSPRLIDLAVAVDAIDAMALCPCCLKGSHGKAVAHAAKAR